MTRDHNIILYCVWVTYNSIVNYVCGEDAYRSSIILTFYVVCTCIMNELHLMFIEAGNDSTTHFIRNEQ